MSYDAERVIVGREPLTVVDLILDTCANTYGVAPCTATGAAGTECYNTRKTCQDAPNFNQTTKTYRFCEQRYQPPAGQATAMYPALVSWTTAPSKLTPGKGLGYRASLTITLQDFPHHDRGIDPYISTRTAPTGTFFGRLLARNPYYAGRSIKLRMGYVSSSGLDLDDDFRDYLYTIDKFEGPDANGRVRITAKDLLKLVDDKRAQCPVASQGRLSVAVTAVGTSLTLDDVSGYPPSGYVRIGSEIVSFSGATPYTSGFSSGFGGTGAAQWGIARAQWGTTASSHSAGDTAQLCVVYDATTVQNCVAVVHDLLDNYTTIDAETYIDYGDDQVFTADAGTENLTVTGHTFGANDEVYVSSDGTLPAGLSADTRYWVLFVDANTIQLSATRGGSAVDITDAGTGTHTIKYAWNYERDTWLIGKSANTILSQPTGVNKLLGEMTEQFGFDVWWDEENQKVRLKANAPARFGRTSIDDTSLLEDSMQLKAMPDDRLSQVWFAYDRIDASQDSVSGDKAGENFRSVYVQADLEKEGVQLYGEPRIKKIFSRWITAQGTASAGSGRMLNRFADNPVELEFDVDAGATLPDVADEITVSCRLLQDTTGANLSFDCQVIGREKSVDGSRWTYTVLTSGFTRGRYGFIAPNGTGEYTAESAANQARYAWVARTATQDMSNEDEPYRII